MPHIRIRGMSEDAVKHLSHDLPPHLAKAMGTDEDNFTVEKIETNFYRAGKFTTGDPMIEVLWFDRGQEVQDSAAVRITELAKKHTSSEFIAVVFTALPKTSYYENGKHF